MYYEESSGLSGAASLPRWVKFERENAFAEQRADNPLYYRFLQPYRGVIDWPYDSVLLFVQQYQQRYGAAVNTDAGSMYVQQQSGGLQPVYGRLPASSAGATRPPAPVGSGLVGASVGGQVAPSNNVPTYTNNVPTYTLNNQATYQQGYQAETVSMPVVAAAAAVLLIVLVTRR